MGHKMLHSEFEQRHARRYDIRLPLTLIRCGRVEPNLHCLTRNISSKGVLFRGTAQLQIGDVVEYVITLDNRSDDEDPARISCFGKVVRCSPQSDIAVTLERYEFLRSAAQTRTPERYIDA